MFMVAKGDKRSTRLNLKPAPANRQASSGAILPPVKTVKGFFAVRHIIFSLKITFDHGLLTSARQQGKDMLPPSVVGHGNENASARFQHPVQFADKFDGVEIEMLHGFPAQNRVVGCVGQRQLVRSGTGWPKQFKKINIVERDIMLPVNHLQRADHRVVALQNGVAGALFSQQKRRVSKKRADLEHVSQII